MAGEASGDKRKKQWKSDGQDPGVSVFPVLSESSDVQLTSCRFE